MTTVSVILILKSVITAAVEKKQRAEVILDAVFYNKYKLVLK